MFSLAAAHELIGDGQCVDETAARGLDTKRWTTATAQTRLQHDAGVGEHQVGRRCGKDDEVDVCGRDASRFDGTLSGHFSHIDRGFTISRVMAADDTRALADPAVGGLHDLLQLGVVHHTRGQV